MISFSLIAKATLAVAGVGFVIAIPSVLPLNAPLGKKTKSHLPSWLQALNDKCYVVPTNSSDKVKLLVCANPEEYSTSNDLYFLYGHEGQRINKRVSEVTKDARNNQIKVKLQGETLSSAQKEVTLSVDGKNWEGITETIKFASHCSFTSYSDRSELSCNFDLNRGQKTIPLTKFVVG